MLIKNIDNEFLAVNEKINIYQVCVMLSVQK